MREAPAANRRSDVKPAVRIERLERAHNPERGVRYVVSSTPDGEPDDDPGLPPMTEEEWEAEHVAAWATDDAAQRRRSAFRSSGEKRTVRRISASPAPMLARITGLELPASTQTFWPSTSPPGEV